MNKNIIVWDKFYSDPFKIRQTALSSYLKKNPNNVFESEIVECSNDDVLQRTKRITGLKNLKISTKFIACTSDSITPVTFSYNCTYIGMVNLNLPHEHAIEQKGINFFYNKNLGTEHAPRSKEEADIFGYTTPVELADSNIFTDSSNWSLYASLPLQYNRIVLFDPYLWHSYSKGVGTDVPTGCLSQIFYVSELHE